MYYYSLNIYEQNYAICYKQHHAMTLYQTTTQGSHYGSYMVTSK